ncbi:MAG: NADH-quinone oxidoreductase subunit H [candidate division NC10 bacterium RIFCSPLOWO2_02_FULL_66_22]|nr:MAG: NADH-quinone oxidoreductase subunit H [candidate division NC10 bacterium RIFCSPLOWO2_02_FULL_66_22]
MLETLIVMLVKIGVVFGALLLTVAYMTWIERKVIADIQVRLGPTRVGPYGLLQPIADGLKLMFKEDLIPSQVDRAIFLLAPSLSIIPAFIAFAVIPFGDSTTLFGLLSRPVPLHITDIDVGVLFVFGAASLGVYGIVLAGWSSNNKYSLLGGLRSSAQLISYELPMGLSVVGVLLLVGSLSLVDIVKAQAGVSWWFGILPVPNWFLFSQPLGFCIYFCCALAETNRAPFDLPEAETELVAGFHTEYSSMKFAMFFMAEYANMITVAALATTLFLGGWLGPIAPSPVWFLGKVFLLLFLFIWFRATLPRFRYDQLMNFGWKRLLPLALLNTAITAIVAVRG